MFLCSDTVHTAQAVRILLLPLDVISGQSLLGTNSAGNTQKIKLCCLASVPFNNFSIPAAEKHRFSTTEQLKSKTSCISMICVCLTNTPHISLMVRHKAAMGKWTVCLICSSVITSLSLSLSLSFHQPADVLPCPPGLIVTAVLTLLTICSGHTSLSSEVFRNVIGSGKVQKCALEALTALSCCPGI